jgi:hypothetical protein
MEWLDSRWIGKDLEGSGRGRLMEILSLNLPGGTEEDQEYRPEHESRALPLRQPLPAGFLMRGMGDGQ